MQHEKIYVLFILWLKNIIKRPFSSITMYTYQITKKCVLKKFCFVWWFYLLKSKNKERDVFLKNSFVVEIWGLSSRAQIWTISQFNSLFVCVNCLNWPDISIKKVREKQLFVCSGTSVYIPLIDDVFELLMIF